MSNTETIIFGGGCFWCIEAIFKRVPGVEEVTPGYAGGILVDPNYEKVSSGLSGHAEVVKVDFDKEKISLEQLLEVFFLAHDPTSINRQGADVGSQYRSIVLYTTDQQKRIIEDFIKDKQSEYNKPIVTQVRELEKFYKAEDYHIDYYDRNKENSYCRFVIQPKLAKIFNKS